jgi:hypothetical protein
MSRIATCLPRRPPDFWLPRAPVVVVLTFYATVPAGGLPPAIPAVPVLLSAASYAASATASSGCSERELAFFISAPLGGDDGFPGRAGDRR